MDLTEDLKEVRSMTREEREAWAKRMVTERSAPTEPEVPQADRDADYLAAVGFGLRYQRPLRNLVPTDILQPVRSYCDEIAAHMQAGRGMLIVGPPGVGKTHILALVALAARGVTIHRGMPQRTSTEYLFGPKLFDTLHHGKERDMVRGWQEVDLLLLDDVCRLYRTEWGTNRFDDFIEARYADMKTTVATMNALDVIEDEKLSRLRDRWAETMIPLGTQATSQRERGA